MEGNLAEVKMGELAQKNGNSDGVRSFGQMLQQDHAAANKTAESVAQSMGMTPPTEPTKKQKADYDKLSKLSGGRFDREFVNHMVMDHKKDIREFEKEAKKKSDATGGLRQRDAADAAQAPRHAQRAAGRRERPVAASIRRRGDLRRQPSSELSRRAAARRSLADRGSADPAAPARPTLPADSEQAESCP